MSSHSNYDPEVFEIRDALRDLLSPRTAQTGPQLFERVTADYGHVDERRLWRHLKWLCQRGIAVRLAPIHCNQSEIEGSGYLRGTGIEYRRDAWIRLSLELCSLGHCPRCFGELDGRNRYSKHICWACYLETRNSYRRRMRAA